MKIVNKHKHRIVNSTVREITIGNNNNTQSLFAFGYVPNVIQEKPGIFCENTD